MLSFLVSWVLLGAHIFYFVPPEGWVPARPKGAASCVQIGFVGQGATAFHPSLNIATEETSVSLKEYVKAVKAIHLSQIGTQWLDLGSFRMKVGLGHLIQLEVPSPLGPQIVLQALWVQEGKAHILTGACLKEEIAQFRPILLEALRSFDVIADILAPVADPIQHERLHDLFAILGDFAPAEDRAVQQTQQWQMLQTLVDEVGQQLGAYWQYLVLQEGYQKIYASGEQL